jgi:hypothetical protein
MSKSGIKKDLRQALMSIYLPAWNGNTFLDTKFERIL